MFHNVLMILLFFLSLHSHAVTVQHPSPYNMVMNSNQLSSATKKNTSSKKVMQSHQTKTKLREDARSLLVKRESRDPTGTSDDQLVDEGGGEKKSAEAKQTAKPWDCFDIIKEVHFPDKAKHSEFGDPAGGSEFEVERKTYKCLQFPYYLSKTRCCQWCPKKNPFWPADKCKTPNPDLHRAQVAFYDAEYIVADEESCMGHISAGSNAGVLSDGSPVPAPGPGDYLADYEINPDIAVVDEENWKKHYAVALQFLDLGPNETLNAGSFSPDLGPTIHGRHFGGGSSCYRLDFVINQHETEEIAKIDGFKWGPHNYVFPTHLKCYCEGPEQSYCVFFLKPWNEPEMEACADSTAMSESHLSSMLPTEEQCESFRSRTIEIEHPPDPNHNNQPWTTHERIFDEEMLTLMGCPPPPDCFTLWMKQNPHGTELVYPNGPDVDDGEGEGHTFLFNANCGTGTICGSTDIGLRGNADNVAAFTAEQLTQAISGARDYEQPLLDPAGYTNAYNNALIIGMSSEEAQMEADHVLYSHGCLTDVECDMIREWVDESRFSGNSESVFDALTAYGCWTFNGAALGADGHAEQAMGTQFAMTHTAGGTEPAPAPGGHVHVDFDPFPPGTTTWWKGDCGEGVVVWHTKALSHGVVTHGIRDFTTSCNSVDLATLKFYGGPSYGPASAMFEGRTRCPERESLQFLIRFTLVDLKADEKMDTGIYNADLMQQSIEGSCYNLDNTRNLDEIELAVGGQHTSWPDCSLHHCTVQGSSMPQDYLDECLERTVSLKFTDRQGCWPRSLRCTCNSATQDDYLCYFYSLPDCEGFAHDPIGQSTSIQQIEHLMNSGGHVDSCWLDASDAVHWATTKTDDTEAFGYDLMDTFMQMNFQLQRCTR